MSFAAVRILSQEHGIRANDQQQPDPRKDRKPGLWTSVYREAGDCRYAPEKKCNFYLSTRCMT